jgi:hypothetical protein
MTSIYVCTHSGNDESNDGSETQPFKTIHKASLEAVEGTTILVNPGIYRERVVPNLSGTRDKPIVYKSTEKHAAIIRGSIPWKPTEFNGEIGIGSIDNELFPDSSHKNGGNPFEILSCVTPFGREGYPESKLKSVKVSDSNMHYCLGQVFVNDSMFTQCPYKEEMEMTEQSWFYDKDTKMLHVNGVFQHDVIEISNQRRLFAPHKRGLKNIIVDGFVFERCGNQYPNRFWAICDQQQAGALGTRSGKLWTIKNNIIQYANGVGIDWGNEGHRRQDLEIGENGEAFGSYGHLIRDNIIRHNGAAGTAAFLSNRFKFTSNIVEYNNNLHFKGKQRWESGGLKVHRPNNSVMNKNIIRYNYCHGIWSDQGAGKNSKFSNNLLYKNEGSGIEFEIGYKVSSKVMHNIFHENEVGMRFSTAGGGYIYRNLFLSSKKSDILTHVFKRGDKWDSLNVKVIKNLFVHSPQYAHINAPNTICTREFNDNTYACNPDEKRFFIKVDKNNRQKLEIQKWRTTMNKYNTEHYDENSECIDPASCDLNISFNNTDEFKYDVNCSDQNLLDIFTYKQSE